MKEELCNLKVHINGQHTLFLNQRVCCAFSGRLKRMIKQEKKDSGIKITGFPGGPAGFELATRFCYNGGRILMTPSNICLLHCSATFLEMTEEISTCNLLSQAETFLDGLFYWTWNDILTSLRSCESFIPSADSSGLLQKLVSSLLAKISANSDTLITLTTTSLASSSSSSSSPDTLGFKGSSSAKTSFSKEWWFDDLTILHPKIIEKIIRTLGAYGNDNKNLVLTRFLLHYLKIAVQRSGSNGGGMRLGSKLEYGGLADTAVHGVVLMGKTAFSCRGLFWVLRVVSGLGLSEDCRCMLEMLMGLMLDQASLDDLLVSGHDGGVYDVNLVLRLIRVFVAAEEGGVSLQRMKKVGRLIDKYLGEISPDQSLKVSKFLAVAESLPDSARDCFDGVYRALDIYLESHTAVSFEERSRLCRCLNYEKLTLEACKDLAKNPRIPPRVTVQALVAQSKQPKPDQIKTNMVDDTMILPETPRVTVFCRRKASAESPEVILPETPRVMAESPRLMTFCRRKASTESSSSEQGSSPEEESLGEKEELRLNLERMQWRVVELEKVCREMKGQMTSMVKNKVISSPSHHSIRGLPKPC